MFAIPDCEHLLLIIKTILTKYDLSTTFRKIQSTFSTVFLIRIIGKKNGEIRIYVELFRQDARYHSNKHTLSTDLKISPKLITRNCHLRKYFFHKKR